MIVSKLLQARTVSLSAIIMITMRVRLTTELRIEHHTGVDTVIPAKRWVCELRIEHRHGVKTLVPA